MDETDTPQTGPAYPSDPDVPEGTGPCPFCGAPVEPDRPACRACGFDFEHMDVGAPPGDGEEDGEGEGEADAGMHPLEVACFECGEVNHRDADFCRKCGAAIGRYSTVKPFERAMATGRMLGRAAARQTPDRVVRIGLWLIALIFLLNGLLSTIFGSLGFGLINLGLGCLLLFGHRFWRRKAKKDARPEPAGGDRGPHLIEEPETRPSFARKLLAVMAGLAVAGSLVWLLCEDPLRKYLLTFIAVTIFGLGLAMGCSLFDSPGGEASGPEEDRR